MLRTVLALGAAALLTASAAAAETKFTLTGDNTKLEFVGKKPDGKHEGGFKKLSGTATITDLDITKLTVTIDIETDSIYSDDAKLTGHLKNADFFDVKNHPKATFKSTKIEKGEKLYTVTGELTMLGKTKTVSFPASIAVAEGALSVATEFSIDRTQWGMEYGKGKIENNVTIKIAVTATNKK
jgi:polyisoprenoid-binding protein YceI